MVNQTGRKRGRFRPDYSCSVEPLFDTRRAVPDLLAWQALAYGAHGWHAVRQRGGGELGRVEADSGD
ncbi:MAG: hypothetical protein N2Z21_01080 [Candidatus Sumerlaeaceae bacterium]|nr:hypothetical protein [Candidatus Sumerlaeaceae bacterium]